jgi:hypothetical protein
VESGRRLPDLNKGVPRLSPYPLLAFSPNGKLLAAANTYQSGQVWLWEVASGLPVHKFAGHPRPVRCLAFSRDGARLVSGSKDTTALVWDLTFGATAPGAQPGDSGLKGLEKLWADLACGDGPTAYRAVWTLAAVPTRAVPFLAARLRPVPGATEARINKLLADLNAKAFAAREAASRELAGLGEQAAPALRRLLKGAPSLEVRRRVEQLLGLVEHAFDRFPSEALRRSRAVQVLERAGTKEARALLEVLARGGAGAWQTQDAKAALQRLAGR